MLNEVSVCGVRILSKDEYLKKLFAMLMKMKAPKGKHTELKVTYLTKSLS